jgi:ATP-dependent Clp protease, protease subunit
MTNPIPTDVVKDNGIYLLMEDITVKSCKEAIHWILEENLSAKKKPFLQLMINSPGGDVSACFALVDAMKGSKIPVRTIGLGLIASCGLLLFIAGERGHRTLTPNTSILSHQWSWGSTGKEHELFATVREFELTSKRLMEHYRKCTGLPEKTIRDVLLPPQDVWLDSKEALKYKLCDRVKTL